MSDADDFESDLAATGREANGSLRARQLPMAC